ncbi:Smr/MutS family protein [Roseovarius sp. SCSIO 43702]|uniref:Smr/MutS family protein n=1 Tax=Roseovarius sp. SCSIO 43702 TaxID=2823043 RepID=UPI001C737E56|nr:Smr/MutS family protein [Roseovarius sp. SCSIO 43702]QYX56983.1 Smr/MutS family protein [Roseovarius sp. SCSIO 43702]
MSRRRPDRDELALWRQVAKTAKPLGPEKKSLLRKGPTDPAPSSASADKPPVTSFTVGEAGSRSEVAEAAFAPPKPSVRMDNKAYKRMRGGRLKPEATLDLHGMTLDRAHNATTGFILRSHANDLRLLLIVTGKGKRGAHQDFIPERQGVLRHQLPHWLSIPPLSHIVLQVSEAHGRHGGGGAFYVYLRRRR